jgi:CheY-like chemotaxis protein
MNKILIVDDEISIRETLKEILEYEGYQVIEATNGEDAYDLV